MMDMANTQKGRASLLYEEPPLVLGAASIVGEKEGNGQTGLCVFGNFHDGYGLDVVE